MYIYSAALLTRNTEVRGGPTVYRVATKWAGRIDLFALARMALRMLLCGRALGRSAVARSCMRLYSSQSSEYIILRGLLPQYRV